MAIERNEVDGRDADLSSVALVAPALAETAARCIRCCSSRRATRHPDFPNVPTARELARSQASRTLIEMVEAARSR